MSFRSCLFGALIAFTPGAALLAQDVVQPQVENSKYHFEGVINTNAVYVRSGPGEGYYSTLKLDKGAKVVVVGIKFDWLKVEPPDGSFSYIGKAFVDLQGDGKSGRVNRADVNVRAGSEMNAMKTTVQSHLNSGDTVSVLGQEDDYLKIKPPADAYVYVNKQFVDATRAIADGGPAAGDGNTRLASAAATQPENASGAGPLKLAASIESSTQPSANAAPAGNVTQTATPEGASATTQPGGVQQASATTHPTVAAAPPPPSAEELFGKFEASYAEITKQPLTDQKLDPLVAGYKSIQNADGLSDNLKRVVDLRIATLGAREESQAKLMEFQQLQKKAAEEQLARDGERQELEAKRAATNIQIFTAVGKLEPSSLQLGGATLYRLIDPGTGYTVVYLRTSDAKVAGLMGQFIGVTGATSMESQLALKIISPTDMRSVDPEKVNTSVMADMIPPSMLARQASASTGSN